MRGSDKPAVRVRASDSEPKGGALQLVPPDGGGGKAAPARAPVAPAAPVGRGAVRPAAEAWAKIAGPLARRKGIRVFFLGVTTKGKSHGVADFLDYVVERHLVEVLLIHDVKKPEPQYEGETIHEADQLYTEAGIPQSYPARRVLRRRNLDHMPSVETAARVTLEMAYDQIAAMLVIDEFDRALTDGGTWDSPSAKRIWSEGADFGASVVATKQLPQYTPTSALAQSDLVIFGLNGKGAGFLAKENYVPAGAADLVARLDQRRFILIPQEGDFDGNVYEVPWR